MPNTQAERRGPLKGLPAPKVYHPRGHSLERKQEIHYFHQASAEPLVLSAPASGDLLFRWGQLFHQERRGGSRDITEQEDAEPAATVRRGRCLYSESQSSDHPHAIGSTPILQRNSQTRETKELTYSREVRTQWNQDTRDHGS